MIDCIVTYNVLNRENNIKNLIFQFMKTFSSNQHLFKVEMG